MEDMIDRIEEEYKEIRKIVKREGRDELLDPLDFVRKRISMAKRKLKEDKNPLSQIKSAAKALEKIKEKLYENKLGDVL